MYTRTRQLECIIISVHVRLLHYYYHYARRWLLNALITLGTIGYRF